MKDYIYLTISTATVAADNSVSWNINSSCFNSMKHNDRLIVKMIACDLTIDNGTDDTIGGLTPIYCNLISSNITTDSGQQLLGFTYTDTKLIGANYFVYTTGTSGEISLYTSPFYKLIVWGNDYPDVTDISILLEVSYYQN